MNDWIIEWMIEWLIEWSNERNSEKISWYWFLYETALGFTIKTFACQTDLQTDGRPDMTSFKDARTHLRIERKRDIRVGLASRGDKYVVWLRLVMTDYDLQKEAFVSSQAKKMYIHMIITSQSVLLKNLSELYFLSHSKTVLVTTTRVFPHGCV